VGAGVTGAVTGLPRREMLPFKAGSARHLDVQKEQGRSESMRLLDGFLDIGGLTGGVRSGSMGIMRGFVRVPADSG
jgi:hypothetical protein